MTDNILFIGGAGFIGSAIINEMLKRKKNRDNFFVLEPTDANLFRLEGLHINIIKGDLVEINYIEKIIKSNNISIIVHLVSTMIPGCGYEDYKKEFENVIFPTVRLIQLCSRLGVLFVFFSSGGTVYGERTSMKPFVETDPKEPISYYGLSKQVIENSILFEHRTNHLQYLIIRPSNPYGHGQNVKGHQGFIAVALGKVIAGEPITVWGDGNSVRDYIYIDDLAFAFSQLLKKGVMNKIINIGSGKGYSVKQIITIIDEIAEEKVEVIYSPSRKNDVTNMILDITLLNSLVNISFKPIELGVKDFYLYEKNQLKHG